MSRLKMLGIFLVFLLPAKAQQNAPAFLTGISLVSEPAHVMLTNETQTRPLAGFAFWCYKRLLSSQDGDHCPFEASCSRYAMESINQYGIFAGTLSGIDRLQRCNGLGVRKYPVNPRTGKRIDPLE